MINQQPRKMIITQLKAGYNHIYLISSEFTDGDVLGRAFWVTNVSSGITQLITMDTSSNLAELSNLNTNTTYQIQGAYYDSMVDSILLNNKKLIYLSDIHEVTTANSPIINSIEYEQLDVDIGSSLPNIALLMQGYADTLLVEYQVFGTSEWLNLYQGAFSSRLLISPPFIGKFNLRIKGLITDSLGTIAEESDYYQYPDPIDVTYRFNAPSKPTDLNILAAKINDTFERFDIKLSWNWEKNNGAGIKTFAVLYTSTSDYLVNGFNKAKVISVGNSLEAIISNFPYNIEHKIAIRAYSFGNYPDNYTDSDISTYILNSSTTLDNNFTNNTLVDVSYSGIRSYTTISGIKKQTFLMDANTGSIGLGIPDTNGIFPIQLNGTDGTLYVDGGIITKKINAADFVLTNFTGKDNPALYTEGKIYGSSVAGIWMGYDNTSGLYKFDLGNSSKYIRWDGSKLSISGEVQIGTPLGDVDLSNLVAKRFVYIYQVNTTQPTTPTSTVYPPTGWYIVPQAISSPGQYQWVSQGYLNEITNELEEGYTWSTPSKFSGENGTSGDSSFKSIVFLRSNTAPTTPTGGSYNSPVPIGWSDGIPNGDAVLWSSTRIFTVSGSAPQTSTWTTPQKLTDTASFEVRYSAILTSPGDPTTNPANWTTTGTTGTIWMATRSYSNGVWSTWSVFKSKGETGADGADGAPGADGINGTPGAGFYGSTYTSISWVTATANSRFLALVGRNPIANDIFVQTLSTGTDSQARQYNGSSWVTVALLINGSIVATGTIAGDKLIAGTSISAPVITGGSMTIGGSSGNFSVNNQGAVTINSGTSGARMEIKNNQILVYDDNGYLVVKIGNLSI
jgi:hypothetical protein